MPDHTAERYSLICPECHRLFDPLRTQTFCSDCRSPLLTQYNLAALRAQVNRENIQKRSRGMWRWHELLPVNELRNQVTLGEGDTPLLSLPNINQLIGTSDLLVKDESINPTGSFKARGLAAAVSKAVELGLTEFVIPTAGNAGSALAFYAGRAGCKAHVYMPVDTPDPIQYETRMSGADLHLVQGLISDALATLRLMLRKTVGSICLPLKNLSAWKERRSWVTRSRKRWGGHYLM